MLLEQKIYNVLLNLRLGKRRVCPVFDSLAADLFESAFFYLAISVDKI